MAGLSALRCCALAVLACISPAPVGAVMVDSSGSGQVLLYPYYTVRAASGGTYSTLFSVTNTTEDAKVVRVRFRESRNGREVASLNVYLSAADSWTGAVVASAQGPRVMSTDASCTDPPLRGVPASLAFSNASYTGANTDGEDATLDRANEGFFEVIDLGVIRDAGVLGNILPSRANCPVARATTLSNGTSITAPSGGLMGSANIVNVEAGTLYSYDATALEGFSSAPLYAPAATGTPTLADVNPKTSRIVDGSGLHDATWDVAKGAHPADPVTAVLMAAEIRNWYVLDPVTQSKTNWIVTMPTKPFYVNVPAGTSARPPFESAFTTGGSRDDFGGIGDCHARPPPSALFDREALTIATGGCLIGVPPPAETFGLRWSASVVTFNETRLFGSPLAEDIPLTFRNGWAKLSPFQYVTGNVHRLTSTDTPPVVIEGLPMIGFMANDYVNGTLTVGGRNVLSNYSATSVHRVTRRIHEPLAVGQ
jgi:hypothetical protein